MRLDLNGKYGINYAHVGSVTLADTHAQTDGRVPTRQSGLARSARRMRRRRPRTQYEHAVRAEGGEVGGGGGDIGV